MTTTENPNAHAIGNAKAWLESIVEKITMLRAAEEAGDDETTDAARAEIDHDPLSVQVRSGWYTPGTPAEERDAEEFEILLSTGGPALRIVGDLGQWSAPERPRLQWQDWGTPWTDYATTDAEDEALQAYCACFWFGE